MELRRNNTHPIFIKNMGKANKGTHQHAGGHKNDRTRSGNILSCLENGQKGALSKGEYKLCFSEKKKKKIVQVQNGDGWLGRGSGEIELGFLVDHNSVYDNNVM